MQAKRTYLTIDAEVQRPEVLARPRAGVAQLPQAFLVELEPALDDESGERAAVAQVAAALVRRHWQPQVAEPEQNSLISGLYAAKFECKYS